MATKHEGGIEPHLRDNCEHEASELQCNTQRERQWKLPACYGLHVQYIFSKQAEETANTRDTMPHLAPVWDAW
jgi:hypothetical protein